MTFTVTYRERSGAKAEVAIEAASRAECVAECRRRGISPMGISEGSRRKSRGMGAQSSQGDGTQRGRGARPMIVAAVLLFVAAIGGGVWWWMSARENTHLPEAKKEKPKKAVVEKPAKRTGKIPAQANAVRTNAAAKVTTEQKPAEGENSMPPVGTVLSVRTNDNNLVITEVVGPNGKKKLLTTELHKPVFSNPADQLIAAAMNATMTGQMAPLPLGPESDLYFKEALKKPILDDPDDTEEVKRMKQVVRETREEIVKLMERGQSFAEILEQHRELWNENVRIREGVVAEYRKIVRSGNEEEARIYMEKMNATLGQMGIPPLTENDGQSKKRTRKVEEEK